MESSSRSDASASSSPPYPPDPPGAEPSWRYETPGVWSRETLDSHITVLGALYIAFSVLGILAALGISMIIVGGGLVSGDAEARAITALVGSCIGAFILALSLPGLIGGIYLMKKRRWARILVLILGFLNLINVPFGTLLGAYTIWVLLKPEADEVFH